MICSVLIGVRIPKPFSQIQNGAIMAEDTQTKKKRTSYTYKAEWKANEAGIKKVRDLTEAIRDKINPDVEVPDGDDASKKRDTPTQKWLINAMFVSFWENTKLEDLQKIGLSLWETKLEELEEQEKEKDKKREKLKELAAAMAALKAEING
jgi:hypothetical protein